MTASGLRAAALAALIAAAAPAVAQQPPAASPAPTAQQFTPSHLAAARELAALLKIEDPLRVVLDEMQVQIISTFTTTRPELLKDLREVLVAMNADIAQRREEILQAGVQIFASRFTEPETLEILKFLKSPVGQKYLKEQPEAVAVYFGQVQQWIAGLNEFALAKVRAEMKKRGHEL